MKKTYVMRDGKLVDKATAKPLHRPVNFHVIPDIREFTSPIDGKRITSRKALREHNARHNVIDVGNDPAARYPKRPAVDTSGVDDAMRRALNELDRKYPR